MLYVYLFKLLQL